MKILKILEMFLKVMIILVILAGIIVPIVVHNNMRAKMIKERKKQLKRSGVHVSPTEEYDEWCDKWKKHTDLFEVIRKMRSRRKVFYTKMGILYGSLILILFFIRLGLKEIKETIGNN